MLDLRGLTRRFGAVTALEDVSLSVAPGEVLGLLGPNGAGKTTLMRFVMGVTSPDAGTARWEGRPIAEPQRRRFGYMPEERGLYPKMRLHDQLVYFGRLHGLGRREAAASSRRWLAALVLGDRARSRTDELSHGNLQRAQLAVALVHRPTLLVLDEPFSGLDPLWVDALGELMLEQAAGGATVVFSSHQLDLVERFCERVVILDRGRVVMAGRVEDLEARGPRRLRVVVDGVASCWWDGLGGVDVIEANGQGTLLGLDHDVDAQRVLAAAQVAGPVTHFAFEKVRLSQLFREAVSR
jgi:ABC-2 type transport system ATP-binding protein